MTDRLAGWLVCWLVGLWASWLAGRLSGRWIPPLAGCFAGGLAGFVPTAYLQPVRLRLANRVVDYDRTHDGPEYIGLLKHSQLRPHFHAEAGNGWAHGSIQCLAIDLASGVHWCNGAHGWPPSEATKPLEESLPSVEATERQVRRRWGLTVAGSDCDGEQGGGCLRWMSVIDVG